MKYEKIEIIIPAYNEEKTIAKTLQSVIDQDYKGKITTHLMNDRSDDNTKKITRQHQKKFTKNKKLLIHNNTTQKNWGLATALNKGIQHSTANYILTLHSDFELAQTDWITKAMVFITKHPEIGVVNSNTINIKDTTHNPNNWADLLGGRKHKAYQKGRGDVTHRQITSNTNDLYKRELLKQIHGFNAEGYRVAGEDREISIRIQKTNYKIIQLPLAVNRYRGYSELGLKNYLRKRLQYAEAQGANKRKHPKEYSLLYRWGPHYNLLLWSCTVISTAFILKDPQPIRIILALPYYILTTITIITPVIYALQHRKTLKIILLPLIKIIGDWLAMIGFVKGYITKKQTL